MEEKKTEKYKILQNKANSLSRFSLNSNYKKSSSDKRNGNGCSGCSRRKGNK